MKSFKFLLATALFITSFLSCTSLDEPVDPKLTQVTITTKVITNIDMAIAMGGGEITTDGSSPITARGIVWGLLSNPTVANSKSNDGSGIGSFTSSMTGLSGNTTYFVRAYATNGNGTTYGNQVVFTTTATSNLPILTTTPASSILITTATVGGNITSQGGSAVTARGVVYSTNPMPTTADLKTINGSGTGAFVSPLIGLTLGTKYYVRAYATNGTITAYGNQVDFTTIATLPVTDYYPAAVNNQWVFKLNGVDQAPMKMQSIDIVNSLSYYTFNPSVGPVVATTRLRKLNGDYFIKVEDLVFAAAGSTTTGYEEIFLKDNLAVGGTWNTTFTQTTTYTNPATPAEMRTVNTIYTIEEKGVSLLVNGTTYTDVIRVKAVATTIFQTTNSVTTTETWYSKGVGPIKVSRVSPTSTSLQELSTYILN